MTTLTPATKAKELLEKFYPLADYRLADAKECATICVKEVMEANFITQIHIYPDTIAEGETLIGGKQFWEQVKIEIEKTNHINLI